MLLIEGLRILRTDLRYVIPGIHQITGLLKNHNLSIPYIIWSGTIHFEGVYHWVPINGKK